MCTLLHPLLKNFDVAPNEGAKVYDLAKKEILTRTSSSNIVTDAVSAGLNTTIATATTTLFTSNDLLTRCFDRPHPKIISNSMPPNELDDNMSSDTLINECDDILSY